jgi:hypothetical protein
MNQNNYKTNFGSARSTEIAREREREEPYYLSGGLLVAAFLLR